VPMNVTSNAIYLPWRINGAKLESQWNDLIGTALTPFSQDRTEPGPMVLTYHFHQPHATPPPSDFSLPPECPFSITRLYKSDNNNNTGHVSLWLIREHDKFGEFPHIYAKVIPGSVDKAGADTTPRGVIVLSDTGCGTEAKRRQQPGTVDEDSVNVWNLRTFLAHTINPHETLPYLVITTHCHYDHILGLGNLLPNATPTSPSASPSIPDVQVLASTNAKTFIQPYHKLQKHSLSSERHTTAPNYLPHITTWAKDQHQVIYTSTNPRHPKIATNMAILTTPGHTPDSLTWYDADSRVLCVGDTFYAKTSKATRHAPWGAEPPMPIMFDGYSDLKTWWEELRRVLGWVRVKNRELELYNGVGDAGKGQRVILAAAHVTIGDDAEVEIQAVLRFMAEVLRDEVPKVGLDGGRLLWDHALGEGEAGKYSVLASLTLVESARRKIPKEQWLS
jgi:glyoxylase-like metal-dependent hydrolase (beta-lactamase superfamily II)